MSETLLAEKTATVCVCKPCPWLAAGTLARREWVRFVRQRGRVLGAIGQPLIFWLLFGIGLGPAFRPGAAGLSYLQYFFPGSLVLILLFTAIFATISLIEDRREGFLQAVLVAPVPRWSMVLGKVLGATAIATAQGLIFLALGLTVGVAFSATMLLAALALILIVSFALASLGMIIAWRMDSTQGFHAVMSLLLMPMWLLSGAFFPAPSGDALGWGPWLLAWVMRLNPLTYGVAALQRLLWEGQASTLPGGVPSAAVAWSVTIAFAVVAFLLACRVARRPTSGDLL